MNANERFQPLNAESIEALVKEVQVGRAESYRALVLHYQRRLHLYCYHMLGNASESEDAVQEVFLKAYREIGKYRPSVSFSAWVYKIAYRHCLNAMRQRKGQQRLISLIKLHLVPPVPQRSDENARDLLDGLSPKERQLVILRTFEERSFAEIAELTGTKATTLRKQFERIRKKLNDSPKRKEFLDDRQSLYPGL